MKDSRLKVLDFKTTKEPINLSSWDYSILQFKQMY